MFMKEPRKVSGVPRVIAVTSGKGGTGKTFVTINLAGALSRSGNHVLLLDGDFGLANVHPLLGEHPGADISAVLEGRLRIEDILLPVADGFAVIPGARGRPSLSDPGPGRLSGLICAMDALTPPPDVLLIDTAGTISVNELRLIAAAGEVVVVTTPDAMALQDAAEYMRQLHDRHFIYRFLIIANKTRNHREAQSVMEKLQNLVGFHVNVVLKPLGHIPRDESVRRAPACMASVLEADPSSRAAGQLTRIAARLCAEPPAGALRGGLTFFYEKHLKAAGE